MSKSNKASLDDRIARIIDAFGINGDNRRVCSFAFSSRTPPASWKAFTFELPMTFFYVDAPGGNITQVRSLSSGIGKENFVLLALLGNRVVIVFRRYKKDENTPLLIPLRKEEEIERVVNTVRRFNFTSDELSAHSSLHSVVDLLKAGAERHFTNRGLFSTYFLKERLSSCLSERKRNPKREAREFLKKFWGEFPSTAEKSVQVLESIGYQVEALERSGYPEYALRSRGRILDVSCVVATVEALDIKTGERVAPSYQAVSALRRSSWVILTNGRLWRLYSGRVSSLSTNYFEVDLDGVASETDARLVYFMSLFSSSSFTLREEATDIDLVYEGGIKHAQEVEADLKNKVFDGELFLSLVKSVLDHSSDRTYSQVELDDGKALALKLLYRLLFILYAESRDLLPVENECYQQFSLEYLRPRLGSFEKEPEKSSVWEILKTLFSMICKGDVESNLPQYNGALFEEDPQLDTVVVKNKFIVPALLDLMESGGRGIDYQNLGVRHLGSLYEALLEYSVKQAKEALVIYKDNILDAKYAQDLKKKPLGYIESGDLYLAVKGLARKGTGSYYTPDEIVTFLVKKGIEAQFQAREEKFKADIRRLPPYSEPRDLELERECTEDLLGLSVLDPAMGSGHFLVAVVNEITRWVISLLEEYPDAPLMREIEESRRSIIEEQRKRGIRLNETLLTDNVILKRMVMKRCVYGVDINPLAVELAKVSLWLDSFTIGTPLTFLDHHIRCGDSLIGSWREKIKSRVYQTTLDRLNGEITEARDNLVESVIMPPDITVEQLVESREIYEGVREKTESLNILLDLSCVKIIAPEIGKRLPANFSIIEETLRKKERPGSWVYVEKEVDVLVSTDILSEGQNLQDSNYVINYDLPWNPMKIVQRAGRVDRLGSRHDTATSAVFIPEKELEDILGLLNKLEMKIQKIADTVGIEATILGERENPKNFNAAMRISLEDQTLLDDLERSAELLPVETPFQNILAYLKKVGSQSLETIPLGRRSGKRSDVNGIVTFYRERQNPEGIHITYYDYRGAKFSHYNDIIWLFRKIDCKEEEPLVLPIKGFEGFRQFTRIDTRARQEILTAVNAPLDARLAQRIKPRHQRELTQIILEAFNTGKITKEKALPIYQILNQENLVAWEEDFSDYLDEYRRHQNIDVLITSIDQLFQKYRIDIREKRRPRALNPEELEVVCYMYLSREDLREIPLVT